MVTDHHTGMRSIGPARETFAAVAFVGVLAATALRCINGLQGAAAGLILTLIALALLTRYRVSWDKDGVSYRNPLWTRRERWSDLSGYTIEPLPADVSTREFSNRRRSAILLQGLRVRLHGEGMAFAIGLTPYSWQDIRHLTDAIGHELPVREGAAALVS